MDTGNGIQPKKRMWIQDMGYNLKKGYGYRIWDATKTKDMDTGYRIIT